MKDMKDELDTLLQREMDRKDFLKMVGISFIAMTGVVSLLKTMNGLSGGAKPSSSPRGANGYGSSAYGGQRKSRQLG